VSATKPGELPADRVYLADTSALLRSSHPVVKDSFGEAILAGRIAIAPPVRLEALLTARDALEFDRLDAELAALRSIPVTRSVTDAAHAAMRALAHGGSGHHRIRMPDYLIAACAQDAGIGVLHYDRHFDRLAEVMDFESRWIAPAGSL